MKNDIKNKLSKIIKGIGYVDNLKTEELVGISLDLFKTVALCDCGYNIVQEKIDHKYNKYHHDHEHTPTCKCCQKNMLMYYLGRTMRALADDGKLPEFDKNALTHAKIRDRTYGHIRNKKTSKITFEIIRHLNAWRDETRMQEITQTWEFNFKDLSLKQINQ
jgi:hypothetical protein